MESLLGLVPFALLVVLCPLMMLFMHRGGHGGAQHDQADGREQISRQPKASTDEVRP